MDTRFGLGNSLRACRDPDLLARVCSQQSLRAPSSSQLSPSCQTAKLVSCFGSACCNTRPGMCGPQSLRALFLLCALTHFFHIYPKGAESLPAWLKLPLVDQVAAALAAAG